MEQGLYELGNSVFNGGITTFLCIATLATTDDFALHVFFIVWSGMVLFALLHGLVLLPALLSMIGSIDKVPEKSKEKI